MSKRSGFSLIELILSLGLFSLIWIVFLKLNSWERARSQAVWEEQNLMAYAAVLEWMLKCTDGPKMGIWSGYQDPLNHERKFVRGIAKGRKCFAKIDEEENLYRVVLRGTNIKKIAPLEFFIAKNPKRVDAFPRNFNPEVQQRM